MDLNTILIILGVLALIALVAHGIWSNRREKSRYFQNANTFEAKPSADRQQSVQQTAQTPFSRPAMSQQEAAAMNVQPVQMPLPEQQNLNFDGQSTAMDYELQGVQEQRSVEQQINNIKITLPNEPQSAYSAPDYRFQSEKLSQNTPHFGEPAGVNSEPTFGYDVPRQPEPVRESYVAPKVEQVIEPVAKVESIPTNVDPFSREPQTYQSAPTISLSQADNETREPSVELNATEETNPAANSAKSAGDSEQNFVMLYVVAPENRQFAGVHLAKAFDSLGFVFGQQHIYHRHLDLTSASPVLFSAANIQQPGTFDPYDMDNFSTVGVAIFMQLPSVGNDRANLKMMIRAARSLADDLGGYVLTEQQEIFNDSAEQEYLSRVA